MCFALLVCVFLCVASKPGDASQFRRVLGRGSFKTVYAAFDTADCLEVAWNKLHVDRLTAEERKKVMNEVQLLGAIQHKNIIRLYDSFTCSDPDADGVTSIAFITEQMMSGTLKEYLMKAREVKVKVIRKWCSNILAAISYLHEQRIMHRDIKLDNLFINGHVGEVKIGDLGLSAVRDADKAGSVIGTPAFMSPEIYEETYTEKVDIYAFGMCLLEMITMELPYEECKGPAQIMKKVFNNEKPASFKRLVDCDVKDVISACLEREPLRPSAKELCEHPLFRDWKSDDGTRTNLSLMHEQQLEQDGQEGDGLSTLVYSDPLDRNVLVVTHETDGQGDAGSDPTVTVEATNLGAVLHLELKWPIQGVLKSVSFAFNPGDKPEQLAADMVKEFDLDSAQVNDLTEEIQLQVNRCIERRERQQEDLARSPQVLGLQQSQSAADTTSPSGSQGQNGSGTNMGSILSGDVPGSYISPLERHEAIASAVFPDPVDHGGGAHEHERQSEEDHRGQSVGIPSGGTSSSIPVSLPVESAIPPRSASVPPHPTSPTHEMATHSSDILAETQPELAHTRSLSPSLQGQSADVTGAERNMHQDSSEHVSHRDAVGVQQAETPEVDSLQLDAFVTDAPDVLLQPVKQLPTEASQSLGSPGLSVPTELYVGVGQQQVRDFQGSLPPSDTVPYGHEVEEHQQHQDQQHIHPHEDGVGHRAADQVLDPSDVVYQNAEYKHDSSSPEDLLHVAAGAHDVYPMMPPAAEHNDAAGSGYDASVVGGRTPGAIDVVRKTVEGEDESAPPRMSQHQTTRDDHPIVAGADQPPGQASSGMLVHGATPPAVPAPAVGAGTATRNVSSQAVAPKRPASIVVVGGDKKGGLLPSREGPRPASTGDILASVDRSMLAGAILADSAGGMRSPAPQVHTSLNPALGVGAGTLLPPAVSVSLRPPQQRDYPHERHQEQIRQQQQIGQQVQHRRVDHMPPAAAQMNSATGVAPGSSPSNLSIRTTSFRSAQSDDAAIVPPVGGVRSPGQAGPSVGPTTFVDGGGPNAGGSTNGSSLVSNGRSGESELDQKWYTLCLELMYNASRGRPGPVEQKLTQGASVTFADYDKRTPLHLAAAAGSLETVNVLLDNGADVNAQDRWGRTPFKDAMQSNHPVIMERLREAGAEENPDEATDDKPTIELLQFSAQGNLESVMDRVRSGVPVTTCDYEFRTALHLACSSGHADVVDFLLLNGADPRAKDRMGRTPVDNAVNNGHRNVLEVLKRQESDVTLQALRSEKRVPAPPLPQTQAQGQRSAQAPVSAAWTQADGSPVNGNGSSGPFSAGRPHSLPPNPEQLENLRTTMAITHSLSMGHIGIEADEFAASKAVAPSTQGRHGPVDTQRTSSQSLPPTPFEAIEEDVDEEHARILEEYDRERKRLDAEHRAKIEGLRRKKTVGSRSSMDQGSGSWAATPQSVTPMLVSGTTSPAIPLDGSSLEDSKQLLGRGPPPAMHLSESAVVHGLHGLGLQGSRPSSPAPPPALVPGGWDPKTGVPIEVKVPMFVSGADHIGADHIVAQVHQPPPTYRQGDESQEGSPCPRADPSMLGGEKHSDDCEENERVRVESGEGPQNESEGGSSTLAGSGITAMVDGMVESVFQTPGSAGSA